MRAIARPQRQQQRSRSLMGLVAAALAVLCVVQALLLVRPRSSCLQGAGREAAEEGVDDLFRREQQRGLIGVRPRTGGAGSRGGAVGGGRASSLADVRGAPLAFITFGNGAFSDFITNWVLSVQRLGLPFLVGALDARMVEVCKAKGWAHLDVSALIQGNATMFRANFKTFRNMGATKVQLVLTMLEELKVETVVVSDSDTTWLGDPSAYLALHPSADFYISTDCLSHKVEVEWKAQHLQPRCGHVPGNSWGRAFNTGVFAVRNREQGRTLLARWRDILLDPSGGTVVTKTNATLGITDQLALNMILDKAIPSGPVHAAPEDDHVLLLTWAANDSLRLHPLPVALFPSGHVAFVQRLPWKAGVDPLVIHATFQRYPVSMHQSGKRARFREFGMWFLDGPEYYAPPGARYLSYDNDVRRVVDEVAASPRFKGIMPVLHRHLVGTAYQLAQFRDALAAARMLNRTLVLPTSWCWCDYDWTPHVLEKCKIRGSDLRLPFECPSDFVLHIPYMDMAGLDFRMPGFLDNPQVPDALRRGRAEVHMMSAKPALPAPGVAVLAASREPVGVLWPRMTQGELVAALQPLNQTAALTIRGMRPGLLEGFASAEQQAAFDALYRNVTKELYWCCAAQSEAIMNSFPYALPKPYGAGYTPWEAPVMPMPTYCDRVDAKTKEFVSYENHPCSFMRNETAAAMASAINRRAIS